MNLHDFANRYTAAWCSQNASSVAAFFTPDGSLTINDGPSSIGTTAITTAVQSFMSAFPDMVVAMDHLNLEADTIEYHWTLTGTHAESNNPVRISGYEQWTLSNTGLIAQSLGHFDAEEYDRQLQGN